MDTLCHLPPTDDPSSLLGSHPQIPSSSEHSTPDTDPHQHHHHSSIAHNITIEQSPVFVQQQQHSASTLELDMGQDLSEYGEEVDVDDERVVQAILISHNGPQSFPQVKSKEHKPLGSPYVKITEQDGKYDSWVVLPFNEFQDIYKSSVELVRKNLFGTSYTKRTSDNGLFPCEDCGYVYNKDFNLRRHRKEKHALLIRQFKCPYCQKFYLREDNLIRHVRNVHNQDERCVCIHCGAEFFRYHTLKRHILTKHKDWKAHQCSMCEKTFAYKWEIKIHVKNAHAQNPGYTCEICNKTYKRPQSLKEHKQFYHQGQRVICKIGNCNELFNTMANFKRHKREYHVVADAISKRGPTQSEERFKSYEIVPVESLGSAPCSECGISYPNPAELQKHFKQCHSKRTKRVPKKAAANILFKCNQCATTFKEEESYQSHCIKFHSSLSPQIPSDFPFGGKSATPCCDGVCDNAMGLDLSVTSQLLAIEDDHITPHHNMLGNVSSSQEIASSSQGMTSPQGMMSSSSSLLQNTETSDTSQLLSTMLDNVTSASESVMSILHNPNLSRLDQSNQ